MGDKKSPSPEAGKAAAAGSPGSQAAPSPAAAGAAAAGSPTSGGEAGSPPPAPETTLLPPEHWTQLGMVNVDEDDDADSSLGDDKLSSTASISSSILKYRTIQGRTFHSEVGNANYWGTNDERHSESLDILHHLFTLVLDGKLFAAPVENPKKVLDIGTGTGIWAIDVADLFPDAIVTGTDVSPIQPTWVPPNVKFEIEDCTRDWTYPENEFDFVHIRYLNGCIQDWYEFFRQAYTVIAPGGYLESYEASPNVYSDDDTMPADSAIAQWGPLFVNGGKLIGRPFTIVDDGTQRKAMEAAGFVDIEEKLVKVPAGAWPADPRLKEIGLYAMHAVESDVEGFILFFTNVQQWSREQVQVYIAHLRRELRSLRHHVYYYQKIVWGRKPLDAAPAAGAPAEAGPA